MPENSGYFHPEVLVDVDWLRNHLADSTVRVIEVDTDTTAYEQGHIPGAVAFNWHTDLQDQVIRAPVSKAQLEALLSRAGVSNDTTVVLYGDHHNWFATWMFWLLTYTATGMCACSMEGGPGGWPRGVRLLRRCHPTCLLTTRRKLRATISAPSETRSCSRSGARVLSWWMCAHLTNTVESCSRRVSHTRRKSNEVATYQVPPTFPGDDRARGWDLQIGGGTARAV